MQNLHNEKEGISCAILAGGQNKRMGRHKAYLDYHDGRKFIEVIRDKMKAWFDEIFIVTNDKKLFSKVGVGVFEDIIPGKGPLGALHTALTVAGGSRVFCIACDMPDWCDSVIEKVIRASKKRSFDCFIPQGAFGPEPLFAIYRTTIRDLLEREIAQGQLCVSMMLDKCRTCYIDIDQQKEKLININTPGEYSCYADKIKDMA